MFNEMTGDLHMHLRVKKFGSEFRGKPAWFWNGLFEEAYTTDNCDYFYQINDDVESLTPGTLLTVCCSSHRCPAGGLGCVVGIVWSVSGLTRCV